MKYIFIGDVHGKVEAVQEALAKEGKKIFVGDINDSYDRTLEDHRVCYTLILEAIKKGEAECLFGNHELSYLIPKHQCSGWDKWREALIRNLETEIRSFFKPYILLQPDLLISHAGLTQEIWRNQNLTLENLPQTLAEWWPDHQSPMHWIGHPRGGTKTCGGLFWCDFNMEFQPVKELRQIFGHTRGKGIRQKENAYCIDCLDFDKNTFLEMDI